MNLNEIKPAKKFILGSDLIETMRSGGWLFRSLADAAKKSLTLSGYDVGEVYHGNRLKGYCLYEVKGAAEV